MEKSGYIKKLTAIAILVLFTLTQCVPDDNDDMDLRDRLIGDWTCTETATLNPNPMTFTVNITKDMLTTDEIYIHNFYHLGFNEKAKAVVSANSINLPSQIVCDLKIEGAGTYSQNRINMNYIVNDGADIDTVSAVFTR